MRVEYGRVSLDVVQLKTVHLLRLRDDWQGVKGLWRVALILILSVLFSRRPRKSFRVRVLNPGSLTPDLYLCLNPHIFLCFLHGSYVSAYECVWMCVLSKSTYGRRKFSGFGVNFGSRMYTFLEHTVLTFFFLFSLFFCWRFCPFLCLQLFVIVVWNFELYMVPLALLLHLAWNYILIMSGKDTRQDVVSNLIASAVSLKSLSLGAVWA